jgi:hypothetical protein
MMRTALAIFSAAYLIPPVAAMVSDVPLRITQRHLLVDQVYVDGAGPFRFVIDTGAQSSSIRADVAARIGLRAAYRVENESVGGFRYLPAAVASRISLGQWPAEHVELVIHDLDAMRLVDPRVQGVLGQNFLSRFNYLLDVRGRRLSFEEEPAGERIPFRRVSDRMVVRSGDMSLVLDSGCGDLILFHEREQLRETGTMMKVAAVTAAPDVRMGLLPKLRVGERVLKNVQTAVLPQTSSSSDGLLPLTLFNSVYVNNDGNYVVVR